MRLSTRHGAHERETGTTLSSLRNYRHQLNKHRRNLRTTSERNTEADWITRDVRHKHDLLLDLGDVEPNIVDEQRLARCLYPAHPFPVFNIRQSGADFDS
ncbi:hypothetical protein MT347_05500 [Microbacterium sp. VKM Ac-2923]|nr:hypothetical protein [Microbacterium sp. VKM Ac-2923]MCJ1707106.1 hypothetical protein [Microbacterium sp. VKM Ac-2923]